MVPNTGGRSGGGGQQGDVSPLKSFSEGDIPLKFQGGIKVEEKNQENERKIKKSSKNFHRQKTNGPKPMSFRWGNPP